MLLIYPLCLSCYLKLLEAVLLLCGRVFDVIKVVCQIWLNKEKFLMNKLKNTILIVTGYILLTASLANACSTHEELEAKASLASKALYSLPDDLRKEYEALDDQAFDLMLDDKISESCELYTQIIESINELKATGKVCTSEQLMSKIEYLLDITPQLNSLSESQVQFFRQKVNQVNALVQADKNLEACALYDQIFADAEKLGIKSKK
jgi:hypothetical protein